ncbi:intradiol ring-cleavage dioxygenase [Aspergillus candidus]|uniref:Extracellular dioxygenase n=1 Tax=Aspergillus candidus TaxID=41067 RepID=A0A2I2FEJ8_ASPCN|nr:extracellular dioxygenase [Aspergillus candidus]PLB39062.1 extracellular dioxygenase [Aspergillus candidus]
MVRIASTLVAGLVGLASVVSAHPGHDIRAEAAERAAFIKRTPLSSRSLAHCAPQMKARGLERANMARRRHAANSLRRKRDLAHLTEFQRRDHSPHHSDLDVDQTVDPSELFKSGGTCILGPDVTEGPYYVSGELIRTDVSEEQAGVPLFLDIQLVDTKTCEPVPEAYIEIWHCNATGVYSGVVANGNGDPESESNLDATFLRGIQQTSAEGVVQFETIFPGHYTGRTTHVHVLSHPGDTKANENDTLSDLYTTTASYVGQIFFDQELINAVEKTETYAANTQPLTTNDEDGILAEEAAEIDPFAQYVTLGEGDDVSAGLFGWISLGIDPTQSNDVKAAVFYTEDGGIENPDAGGPPGPPPQ